MPGMHTYHHIMADLPTSRLILKYIHLSKRVNFRDFASRRVTADLCCVRISSFAVDDSVGWLVQVSLTLFAFTPSTSLALPVNAKNVRLTCTSQPTESSTAKLEIRTQHKSTVPFSRSVPRTAVYVWVPGFPHGVLDHPCLLPFILRRRQWMLRNS